MSVVATFSRLRRHRGSTNLENMARNLVNEVKDAMDDQVIRAIEIMRYEPPPPPESSYERSHRYSGSWEPIPPHPGKGGLVAGIRGNAVDPDNGKNYTVWVGGDEAGTGQQMQHSVTGWPLAALAIQGIQSSGAFSRGDDFIQRVARAVRRSKK